MSNFADAVTEAMHLRINGGALPQVVAGALTGADLPSTDLASLVTQVEAALATATQAAEQVRRGAFDVVNSPDAEAARKSLDEGNSPSSGSGGEASRI